MTIGSWKNTFATAPERLQRVTSPVRSGKYSARVEVRPHDRVTGITGERTEVSRMLDRNGMDLFEGEHSGTQFYTVSIMLDKNWQPPQADANGVWGVFLQLHGPNEFATSPALAMNVMDRFGLLVYSGDLDTAKRRLYEFTNGALAAGHWVDWVLRVRYAKDPTGEIEIWRRDEGAKGFIQVLLVKGIPTLQYRSSYGKGAILAHYWRCGFYRSQQTTITNVLWVDCVSRGTSFEAVTKAAWA